MAAFSTSGAWLGVFACIVQSALFAGLNLAVFSLSLLRLQVEADGGNTDAIKVLELRRNANQILATVIWGTVTTNVLLTLLSDSVLHGVAAFFFSAFAITMLGEIIPQAYFSRNALRMTSRFLPFLNFYRVVLYPLAKPTALLLDTWLGPEGPAYMKERDLRSMLARHGTSEGTIGKLEATGAQNFLDLDDISVCDEGEFVDVKSIISLPLSNQRCKGAIGQQYGAGFIEGHHAAGNRLQDRLQLAPPFLKSLVRRRQLLSRRLSHMAARLQILRHVIKGLDQLSHLAARLHSHTLIQLAVGNLIHRVSQRFDRPCDLLRQKQRQPHA